MALDPEIVLGPPGTGKTTSLLNYMEDEIARGTAPDRVGYISFTRKAAEEAKSRAMERFKLTSRQLPWIRTIHSLCFAALGLNSSEVFEGKRVKEFGEYTGMKTSAFVSMDEGSTFGYEMADRCLFMENLSRVKGITLREQFEEDTDGLPWHIVNKLSIDLEEFKRTHGLHDYTDMLTEFVATDWSARLEVLFVDEAQDLSMLQWRVVEKLARGTRRVVIAGDDDQALYRWAGAAVEHFIGLPGRERVLHQSWRVPPFVQKIALDVLSRIKTRREKTWKAREGEDGIVERVKGFDEAEIKTGEDVLVLARNSCFLREEVMPLLRSQGIIYNFRGGSSVKQSVVDAILDWERLRRGEEIMVSSVERVYDKMSAGKGYIRGHKKLPNFHDRDALVKLGDLKARAGLQTDAIWHEALDRVEVEDRQYMLKALKLGQKLTRTPTVKISTIHGAKGGQADKVILLRDMATRTANEEMRIPEDEARVWYVASTRARKNLTIVAPQFLSKRYYDI